MLFGDTIALDGIALEPGVRRIETIPVPRGAYADATLIVRISRVEGSNAVVSSVTILSSSPHPLSRLPDPDIAPFTMPQLSPAPELVAGVAAPRLSLDGTWRFHAAPPADFFRLAGQTAGWHDIEVPGQWTQQGHTVEKGRAAGYWRAFDLPADWRGKVVKLRANGVFSGVVVYVNGREAGSHLGGMTPFELDLTSFLRPGRNTIALAVTSHTLADTLGSLNQYAAHDMGGVLRSMSLWALPPAHLAALHVETAFDAAFKDAALTVVARVARGADAAPGPVTLRFRVTPWPETGRAPVASSEAVVSGLAEHATVIPVPAPRQWDPEHPNLYTLTCDVVRDGTVVERATRRFGFREVRVVGNEVHVNGKPVKLRGATRHEVHPLRGRSLTPEDWKRDAELFRAANVNYIRTSHYPPAEEFIDWCDELGLFVEEEAPVCWVGHGANSTWTARSPYDPANLDYLRQAVLEMIQRDRSHPSVIIWSLANESSWGPLWQQVNGAAAMADPTRPRTFHDQAWGGYNNFGSTDLPIANFHYPGPPGPAEGLRSARPLLFGEFCHLNAYNRFELGTDPSVRDGWGRGFERMWEAMYNSKGILGGAIWSGIDDSFFLPDGQVVGYGTWGPIDGWRREKPEYWHVKKTYTPVKIDPASVRTRAGALEMVVENRHDFSNLREVRTRWSAGARSGTLSLDVPPRARGVIRLPLEQMDHARSVRIEFDSPLGFQLDAYEFPIGDTPVSPAASRARPPAPVVDQSDARIVVRGGAFSYEIDRRTGRLVRATRAGREWLGEGPELMVLPLNNKGGTQMTGENQSFAPFTATCANWQAAAVTPSAAGGGVEIAVKGACDDAEGEYWLRIDGNGAIDLAYAFASRISVNPRQVGMVFTLPRRFAELAWKRRGQWSVYPPDHIGRLEGRAEAFPAGTRVGPAGPAVRPSWPWALDSNELGSNDFRSTKEHVEWARLSAPGGDGVTVVSDGRQHVRAWVENDRVRLLVAFHNTPGAEGFFRSHASFDDRPLKPGTPVGDRIRLEFEAAR